MVAAAKAAANLYLDINIKLWLISSPYFFILKKKQDNTKKITQGADFVLSLFLNKDSRQTTIIYIMVNLYIKILPKNGIEPLFTYYK